jgi:hypothetical protein
MFSNSLSFLSSCNDSDQVSHPYKKTNKIIVLYISVTIINAILMQLNYLFCLSYICRIRSHSFALPPCL